jgi:actin-like protein 6A
MYSPASSRELEQRSNIVGNPLAPQNLIFHPFPHTHPSYFDFMECEYYRELKESHCRISDTPLFDSSYYSNSSAKPLSLSALSSLALPRSSFELPDGNTLELSNERFYVPEHLFAPRCSNLLETDLRHDFDQNIGGPQSSSFKGLHHLVQESVESCDVSLRKELYSNIILSGGHTLYAGLANRLAKELSDLLNGTSANTSALIHRVKILGSTPSERRFAPWLGGSVLASLGTFHQMWISKQEYLEQGQRLLHAKCL